jgi:NADPH:quinone reductase-like Zn-dependent oxidoreductase
VVLYTQEDVVERVKQLTDGKGVKVVYDGGESSSLAHFLPS